MARLYTTKELLNGIGGGWMETWMLPDGDDSDEKVVEPVGFCCGYFVTADGSSGEIIEEGYNRQYESRIWNEQPTEDEREAMPWDGEPKSVSADAFDR